MKKLFFNIITFSIMLVIGCQEKSLTNPVSVETPGKVQQYQTRQGTITLDRMLGDPYPLINSFFIINGEIEYDFRLEVINSGPTVKHLSVFLNLKISAGLTYLYTVYGENNEGTPAGFISNRSNDKVTFTENDRYILEKSYLILGREDEMVLMCRFNVTTNDISLAEIFVVLPEIEP